MINSFRDSLKYSIKENTAYEYIHNRVLPQIEWYSRKSRKNQKFYKLYSLISILASSAIPVVSILNNSILLRIIVAVLGSIVSISSAILSIYNFRDLWIQYRVNSESLKSIIHMFYTNCGIFNNSQSEEEKLSLLVEKCEDYFTKDSQKWIELYSDHSSTNS